MTEIESKLTGVLPKNHRIVVFQADNDLIGGRKVRVVGRVQYWDDDGRVLIKGVDLTRLLTPVELEKVDEHNRKHSED